MGHLINPTSLRLGWVYYWEDIYFCNHLYYPQMLHIIYKLKLYLIFCLRKPNFLLKLGVLFSHFEIVQKGRNFNIFIFIYQSFVEGLLNKFIISELNFLNKFRSSSEEKKLQSFFMFQRYKIIKLLYFFSYAWSLAGKLNHMKNLWSISFFKKLFRYFSIIDFYKDKDLEIFTDLNLNEVFFLWLKYFLNFFFKKKCTFEQVLYEFLSNYLNAFGLSQLLNLQRIHFERMVDYVFNLKIVVYWIKMSNDDVTPKFLSWFLAYKCRQRFSLNSLVRPLQRELRYLISACDNNNNKLKYSLSFNKSLYKKKLKNILIYYYKFFYKEWYLFYKKINIWLTYSLFEFFYSFCKLKMNKKICQNFYFRICKFNAWLQLLSWIVFDNFFFNKLNFLVNNKLITDLSDNILIKSVIVNFENDKIFSCGIWISDNIFYFLRSKYLIDSVLQFTWLSLYKKRSSLKIHEKRKNSSSWKGLSGFKVHFVGRFSRKQRAASLFFQGGSIPLSMIDAKIKFSSSTSRAKNSAITVKVWFYYTNSLYVLNIKQIQ